MCGILFTNSHKITSKQFKGALELMDHRGPDATGYYSSDNFQFGHKRLKILDLGDRSNQPFKSKDGSLIIVFNGEIYNYKELAKRFDITLTTNCDTELVIELYGLIGNKCLDFFEGMFAFVVFNLLTSEVFISRDHLGVKPLYIYKSGQELIVASEIAPILALLNTVEIDSIGIRQYLKLRTFFNNKTVYKNISFFPAGYYLSNNVMVQYWDLPEINSLKAIEDEELKYIIEKSISDRLVADVKVGSLLSGGVDSSIIALLSNQPDTWTIGFEESNEFDFARLVSNKIGSNHNEILIEKDEFKELAISMIKKRKEPLSVPNEVLLYKMSKKIKVKNSVVLSGEGADELFFGYDRIFTWANSISKFDIKEFSKYYSYGDLDDISIVEEAIGPFLHFDRPIDIIARFFQKSHLHGLLRRVDNSTMLSSVEARVPFVDNIKLVELMINLPYKYKFANGVAKYPLKSAFKDILPVEIINRKKVGFPVPLANIFNDNKNSNSFDLWFQFNLCELFGEKFNINDLKI